MRLLAHPNWPRPSSACARVNVHGARPLVPLRLHLAPAPVPVSTCTCTCTRAWPLTSYTDHALCMQGLFKPKMYYELQRGVKKLRF